MEQRSFLYMWAIVPPPDLAAIIDRLRKEFSENFGCYKALKPPVHLTLYAPFKAEDNTLRQHADAFKSLMSVQPAFSLTLKNFGFFENRRSPVAFIDILASVPLKALNTLLSSQTRKIFSLEDAKSDFHPHFTIGYRDITPEIFPAVRQAYIRRPFGAAFDVNSICLFRHNGAQWVLLQEFALGTQVTEQGNLF